MPATVEGTARKGDLTLTGHVSSGSLRKAAKVAVSRLTGVRNVKNEIAIWADADPVSVTLSVQTALERSALVPDDSDVLVDTRGNTVTLTGHICTWAEHDAAVAATWMTTGVMDVVDKLYITGRPRRPDPYDPRRQPRTSRTARGHETKGKRVMFKSTSTSFIWRGILAVIVGIIALAWPGVTILALVILFAIYAFIAAGLQAARAFSSAKAGPVFGHLLLGLVDLAAGVVALAWPGPTALVLVLILGVWAIVAGLARRSPPPSVTARPPGPGCCSSSAG